MSLAYEDEKQSPEKEEARRTKLQNASLHLWCQQAAEVFLEQGLDMKAVLKPEVEIAWNKDMVKEYLWRPIMEIMIQEKSTTEMNTVNPTEILDVISHHMASKHGVTLPPWPSKETQYNKAIGRTDD